MIGENCMLLAPISDNRFMSKFKDITLLFFAGGDGSPDAFAPAPAGLVTSALGDKSIDHGVANLPRQRRDEDPRCFLMTLNLTILLVTVLL